MLGAGETPSALVQIIDKLARHHTLLMNEQFCRVAWDAEDAQALFDLNDAEAVTFLQSIEQDMKDRMVERGWEVMETLGEQQKLKRWTQEDFEL